MCDTVRLAGHENPRTNSNGCFTTMGVIECALITYTQTSVLPRLPKTDKQSTDHSYTDFCSSVLPCQPKLINSALITYTRTSVLPRQPKTDEQSTDHSYTDFCSSVLPRLPKTDKQCTADHYTDFCSSVSRCQPQNR